MANVKQETINGAKWALINKCVVQPVSFVYSMILARLIAPSEMGVLALTSIFFTLAYALKEAGLGQALIRKQDRTDLDCSTVFWFNIAANLLIGLLFWLCAPWFAAFFNVPDLKWITRISSIMMVLSATQSVHHTLFTARRDFKTTTIISIVTTLSGMPVTLYLAYTGWSYWSLVFSGVFTGILSLIIIWVVSPWKPSFVFSIKSFKEFFSFGYKLSLANCVYAIYDELIHFIIGKLYSPAQLALYNRAYHLGTLPASMLFVPLQGIMFPILATIQDDDERMTRVYRQYIRLCTMPMLWILITLAVNANSIVRLFYGPTWEACTPYLQLLCIGFIFSPMIRVNHSYLMVKGRSDLLLKRETNVRIVGLILMISAAFHSVMAICCAFALFSIYNLFITLRYTIKISSLTYREQMRDLLPYLCTAILANIPSFLIWLLGAPFYVCAFAGPGISLILYITVQHLRKDDAYTMLRDTAWNSAPMRKIRARFSA